MIRCSLLFLLLPLLATNVLASEANRLSYADVIADVQPRMVKIFGAGGLRNLESYQSGFFVAEDGYILTAWSYVLDSGEATAMLDDGRRFTAKLIGADPRTELALLKIEATELPYFDLSSATKLSPGSRVLAFSNLYGVATGDEPTSVQHGVVSGVTKLAARRGSFETPYQGLVYVLDAMSNNAGAAGGALTDSQGRLAGVLGKELRDAQTNVWLNYSLPIESIRPVVTALLAGKSASQIGETARLPETPADLDQLGIVLLPNIIRNTPPFIDAVLPNTSAAKTELRPDDLIVLVNGQTVATQAAVEEVLARVDAVDPVRLTVLRDSELLEFQIEPALDGSALRN